MTTLPYTRFRAYRLGSKGDSFSYVYQKDNGECHFTLIEARNPDKLHEELRLHDKDNIDTLHITSWDQDHCSFEDLKQILALYKPTRIETPGYNPGTENGEKCLRYIGSYINNTRPGNTQYKSTEEQRITPNFIGNLNPASKFSFNPVFYWPLAIDPNNANNNSTVHLLRMGAFNVLSMGDVEELPNSSKFVSSRNILPNEVDVLLLAHHGANNDTNSRDFIKAINPRVAICGSNYGNEHDHPKPEVRNTLRELTIPLHTTKTGDVIIQVGGNNNHKDFLVFDDDGKKNYGLPIESKKAPYY